MTLAHFEYPVSLPGFFFAFLWIWCTTFLRNLMLWDSNTELENTQFAFSFPSTTHNFIEEDDFYQFLESFCRTPHKLEPQNRISMLKGSAVTEKICKKPPKQWVATQTVLRSAISVRCCAIPT